MVASLLSRPSSRFGPPGLRQTVDASLPVALRGRPADGRRRLSAGEGDKARAAGISRVDAPANRADDAGSGKAGDERLSWHEWGCQDRQRQDQWSTTPCRWHDERAFKSRGSPQLRRWARYMVRNGSCSSASIAAQRVVHETIRYDAPGLAGRRHRYRRSPSSGGGPRLRLQASLIFLGLQSVLECAIRSQRNLTASPLTDLFLHASPDSASPPGRPALGGEILVLISHAWSGRVEGIRRMMTAGSTSQRFRSRRRCTRASRRGRSPDVRRPSDYPAFRDLPTRPLRESRFRAEVWRMIGCGRVLRRAGPAISSETPPRPSSTPSGLQ